MFVTETITVEDWTGVDRDLPGSDKTRVRGFSDIEKYPEIVELCKKIKAADKLIRRLSKIIPYVEWKDPTRDKVGWMVGSIRYAYTDYNPTIPFLRGPEIRTVGYARLEPGAVLYPHTGHAGDYFRLHYALEVPEGDCYFRIGTQKRKWEEGKFFMFNDMDLHEAWNKTDKPRTIFLVEIDKRHLAHIDEADVRI